jgi:hypothetical protein
MLPQVLAAWIAAFVAIISLAATAILQIVFRYLDSKASRKQEIMVHRRDALHSALEVIDHVYGNAAFGGQPASKPHAWDIKLAWDAMNKMIIYCERPNEAIAAFFKATGLHNPTTQQTSEYGPKGLQEFRSVVCRELGLPELQYSNPDLIWISNLPGSKTTT